MYLTKKRRILILLIYDIETLRAISHIANVFAFTLAARVLKENKKRSNNLVKILINCILSLSTHRLLYIRLHKHVIQLFNVTQHNGFRNTHDVK